MKKSLMNDVKINNYFDNLSPKKLEANYKEDRNEDKGLKKTENKIENNYKKEKPIKIKKNRKGVNWVNYTVVPVSIVLLFGLIYFISNLFFNAKVFIIPKTANFDLKSETIKASKSFDSNTNFEIMITSYNESKSLTLGNKEEVSLYAKGEVTFYNKFSTTPIKLDKGTHISDEEGKEYILDNAIIIPGYKMVNSKIIEGKIDVNITAFLPGESYNTESPTFKVNNFKNTSKYEKVYASLKTKIEGGIDGVVYSLTEDNKSEVKQFSDNEFSSNLINKIKAEIPEGYILYPSLVQTTKLYKEDIKSKEMVSNVELSGTANAIILKRDEFEKSVIRKLIPGISNIELTQVQITNLDNLNVNFKNKDQKITKDLEDLSLEIVGKVSMLWSVDTDSLRFKLSGIERDKSNIIFADYIGIDKATLKIFPPWKKVIPVNYAKIKVIIK